MPPGAHDDAGFTELFRSMHPQVRAFLARRVDAQAVDDLTAEVFTRAWNAWQRAPEPPGPWIYGIAHHLVADRYRDRTRQAQLLARVRSERPHDDGEADGVDMSIDVRRAWAQLSAADQETLALIAWDGLSVTDAATVVGCTRAAYSVRLTRARRRLRELLEAQPLTAQHATAIAEVSRA